MKLVAVCAEFKQYAKTRIAGRGQEAQMAGAANRAGFWNGAVWASIDTGVLTSVGDIRVMQKVITTTQLPGTTSVPADHFDPATMGIEEGMTRAYTELAVQFRLTNGQVNEDSSGTTALTLAKLAAKSLALAEDLILLRGADADLPAGVTIESGRGSLGAGILGLAAGSRIEVRAPSPRAPTNSGGQILSAVSNGIAMLTANVQAPPFALIADTNAFAAIWGSVINGAPAYTVLTPVLTGGIYGTAAMPMNTAVLIALGGDPTTIYVGSDAVTEPTYKDAHGAYFFRTFERVQYVARDDRAFVRLDFPYLADPEAQRDEVTFDADLLARALGALARSTEAQGAGQGNLSAATPPSTGRQRQRGSAQRTRQTAADATEA
jgi:hypothetical protein